MLLARFHHVHRNGVDLRRIVVGILQNREAAQNLARLQHLPAHADHHVFQAQAIGVGMVALRSGEFSEPDRHHLEQSALDPAREIGVPLDAAHQHDAVGIVRHLVHEGFDAVRRLAERHHFQLADERAAHAGFGDPIARQHLSLAGRIRRAVTSHGREDHGLHALLLPVLNRAVHDGGDVVYAAAAYADRDARAGLQPRGESSGGKLCAHGAGDIDDPAIRKLLANDEEAGKLHDGFILA